MCTCSYQSAPAAWLELQQRSICAFGREGTLCATCILCKQTYICIIYCLDIFVKNIFSELFLCSNIFFFFALLPPIIGCLRLAWYTVCPSFQKWTGFLNLESHIVLQQKGVCNKYFNREYYTPKCTFKRLIYDISFFQNTFLLLYMPDWFAYYYFYMQFYVHAPFSPLFSSFKRQHCNYVLHQRTFFLFKEFVVANSQLEDARAINRRAVVPWYSLPLLIDYTQR